MLAVSHYELAVRGVPLTQSSAGARAGSTLTVLERSGRYGLLERSKVDPQKHVLVTYRDQDWLYLETDDPFFAALRCELLIAPDFGLRVWGASASEYAGMSVAFVDHLVRAFGVLCFRNFSFPDKEAFVAYCAEYGKIYHWPFGPVHVVKPADEPDGLVHSLEKAPLHWDLGLHPLSDENVKRNPWFCADKFMLYCKAPPVRGEGQTTVVSGRQVLRLAGPSRLEEWRRTRITYDTPRTYFGGDPRTYPLVHTHPVTGETIFRYQEGSTSSLQRLVLRSDDIPAERFESLVAEIDALVYDPRCMVAHEWEADDLLIVDNYLTLHGRLPMTDRSRSRELWRVQTVL
jgi:alpha-ketoglutarate-dependent taurine dioxygenase